MSAFEARVRTSVPSLVQPGKSHDRTLSEKARKATVASESHVQDVESDTTVISQAWFLLSEVNPIMFYKCGGRS